MTAYDIAIIGAGIAGASIASEIADLCSVLVLEAEDQPGYHSTGRSAAFWTESYGGPKVQPLTTASRAFLEHPPIDFSETGFLKPRGAINIAQRGKEHLVEKFIQDFSTSDVKMERWGAEQLQANLPHLNSEWEQAVYEPDCFDIDVAALHASYLKTARRAGCDIKCNARVNRLEHKGGRWEIHAGSQRFSAHRIVNAAGAWADHIAQIAGIEPVRIRPMRRTMVQIKTSPPSLPDARLVIALDGSFYFKPEVGGDYWLSPHDEIPDCAGDAAPEELDVAIAIDRFQSAMDIEVESVTRKWAGLRSFAPDRLPVYGFDPVRPEFFWFAGQGGFGIQTAPAAAKLAKAILLAQPRDETVSSIDADLYSPARFTK